MLSFNIQSFCHCIFCLFFSIKNVGYYDSRFNLTIYNLIYFPRSYVLILTNLCEVVTKQDPYMDPKNLIYVGDGKTIAKSVDSYFNFLVSQFWKTKIAVKYILKQKQKQNKKTKQNKTKTLIFNVVPQIICQVKSTIDENHYSHTCKINSMSH